jgi:solute carrier family 25 ornithine transporter 2/15
MTSESVVVFSFRESAKDVTASFVGAACCCFVGQPFDTIKVRLQSRPEEFTGVLQGTMRTVRREGLLALWKGWQATLTGQMMESAAAFGVNNQLKRMIPEPGPSAPNLQHVIHSIKIGALTGVASGIVLCPADNVKIKTQFAVNSAATGLAVGAGGATAVTAPPTPLTIFYRIMRKQGAVRGFFTGLDAQLMRDGPFYMTFFASYDLLNLRLADAFPVLPSKATCFLSGGFAGMIGWVVAMPFDGAKSIIQSSHASPIAGALPRVMREVFAQRGIQGLFTGFGPAVLRAFPANGALFVGYETARSTVSSW